MYKCLNCGNEFEGKFCPECGAKKIDENCCPNCGAHHGEGVKFCSECGTRLDGKRICAKCGALMDANSSFCGTCGAEVGGKAAKKSATVTLVKTTDGITVDKVMKIIGICGIISVMVAALMGLVFTFVSGVSIFDTDKGKAVDTEMLYYYFSKVYKEIKDARDGINTSFGWKSMGEVREFALYFPAVLGTVVSALGILGTVGMSVLTGITAYKRFAKKEQVNVVTPAVATYFIFVTMATLLLVLSSSGVEDIKTYFSAPTLAGLIVGGVFLALGIILLAVSNYRQFMTFNSVVGTVCSFAVCALTVVIVALVALPACRMTVEIATDYYGTMDVVSSLYGLFPGMQSMLLLIRSDSDILKIVIFATVGGVAAVGVAVICGVTFIRKLPSFGCGKNKCNLVLSAVALGLSIAYLVFAILFNNASINAIVDMLTTSFGEIEGAKESISQGYAAPIALLVMSVAAFAIELVAMLVKKPEVPSQTEEQSNNEERLNTEEQPGVQE